MPRASSFAGYPKERPPWSTPTTRWSWNRRAVSPERSSASESREKPTCGPRPSEATPEGLRFTAIFRGEEEEIATVLRGRHNVYNLLGGLAAASALDVPFRDAARALSRLRPATHRGERLDFGGGFVLLDETYNSNPRALRAALASLCEERALRRIAVVGDMRELGEKGAELHREVGRFAAALPIDRLIGVGPLARDLIAGARGCRRVPVAAERRRKRRGSGEAPASRAARG